MCLLKWLCVTVLVCAAVSVVRGDRGQDLCNLLAKSLEANLKGYNYHEYLGEVNWEPVEDNTPVYSPGVTTKNRANISATFTRNVTIKCQELSYGTNHTFYESNEDIYFLVMVLDFFPIDITYWFMGRVLPDLAFKGSLDVHALNASRWIMGYEDSGDNLACDPAYITMYHRNTSYELDIDILDEEDKALSEEGKTKLKQRITKFFEESLYLSILDFFRNHLFSHGLPAFQKVMKNKYPNGAPPCKDLAAQKGL